MSDHRSAPAEQMLTVLDVLWEELQARTSQDCTPAEEEVVSALWQIHELVFAMAAELSNCYDLLERVLEDGHQRQAVHSILFGPDGEKL